MISVQIIENKNLVNIKRKSASFNLLVHKPWHCFQDAPLGFKKVVSYNWETLTNVKSCLITCTPKVFVTLLEH